MTLSTLEKIRTLQRKLYIKAKQDLQAVGAFQTANINALAISVCLDVKNIGKPYTGKPYAGGTGQNDYVSAIEAPPDEKASTDRQGLL